MNSITKKKIEEGTFYLMSKINLIGVDDIQLKKCTDGTIELWFGNVLGERFTTETFIEFVKIMQDATRIFEIEPKMQIPVGYYPGQSPLMPRSGGSVIGTMPNIYTQVTCQNSEGGPHGNT
jgi:hypothetical protein